MVYNVLVVDFSFQVNYTTIKTAVSFFEMAVLFFYSAFSPMKFQSYDKMLK